MKMKGTYKSNANTTDLNIKLLKTVAVNVQKSKYDRKVSSEKVKVVLGGGEGRFFLKQAGARKF